MLTELLVNFPNCYIGIATSVGGRSASKSWSPLEKTLHHQLRYMIPLDRILLETDAPYLPPSGVSASFSYPSLIAKTIRVIAEYKRLSVAAVAAQCRKNSYDIYGI